jgi:hypothetical protein
MPYYGVIVTGPAVTVIPPEVSVTVAFDPAAKVYLSVPVTVILNPDPFSNVEAVNPPGDPCTFLNLTVSFVLLP